MVVKEDDRTIGIVIDASISSPIKRGISHLEMRVVALRPEIEAKHLHGEIDCLTSSDKK